MTKNSKVPLYSMQGRFLRLLAQREAENLRRDGKALAKRDASGRIVGCKLREMLSDSASTPTAISARETLLYAFASSGYTDAKSKTANLTESKKLSRELAGKRAEDAIERAQVKVEMWFAVPLTNTKHEPWAGKAAMGPVVGATC